MWSSLSTTLHIIIAPSYPSVTTSAGAFCGVNTTYSTARRCYPKRHPRSSHRWIRGSYMCSVVERTTFITEKCVYYLRLINLCSMEIRAHTSGGAESPARDHLRRTSRGLLDHRAEGGCAGAGCHHGRRRH